jgi:hypothetical protein
MEDRVMRWVSGATLNEIEGLLRPPFAAKRRCKSAREFVNRFMVEFAHLTGTVAQVYRRQLEIAGEGEALPLTLAVMGACVRDGLATPYQLAVRYETDVYATSRVACHRLGDELETAVGNQALSFADLRERAKELAEAHGVAR